MNDSMIEIASKKGFIQYSRGSSPKKRKKYEGFIIIKNY